MRARGWLGIAALMTIAGCTAHPPDHPPPSTSSAAFLNPGTRHVSLGCADAAVVPVLESVPDLPFGELDGSPRTVPLVPPRAEDVGLRLPAGMHWYFQKIPVAMRAGAPDATVSTAGPGEALVWVPGEVWTSSNGGGPDLRSWVASSVTLHSCPDRPAMFLGGLLAADPTTCMTLTVSQPGTPGRTLHQRLDGVACTG